MSGYKHSVSLMVDKCRGCTHCLRRCPTEAIRIRDGHAVINSERCIDCGECIRVCPYNAKKATFDAFDDVKASGRFLIALPPPSLYGQFSALEDADDLMQGLLESGFDDVFEVARAAELVTEYTRNYIKRGGVESPILNSACPAITRLINLRFPYLAKNIIPMRPPIEVASVIAKREALEAHPELKPEDIATVFISPCPAKASFIKNGFDGGEKSSIDYVVAMNEIYFLVLSALKKKEIPRLTSQTGMIGMSWASTGGEATALMNDQYLAADGIENVIHVLDEIETGNFPKLRFVELNACNGGCVGGVATVENPYIARVRLQTLRRYLPVSRNRITPEPGKPADYVPESFWFDSAKRGDSAFSLDSDMSEAMKMMSRIETICEELPSLDCGFCGSPTCHAFAEDIVRGEASIDECIVLMREKIQKMGAEEQGEDNEQ